MALLASVVDGDALLNVLWASLAAGLGVTAAFSLAIFGATRAVDLRRDGRALEASVAAAFGLVGLVGVIGSVTLGMLALLA